MTVGGSSTVISTLHSSSSLPHHNQRRASHASNIHTIHDIQQAQSASMSLMKGMKTVTEAELAHHLGENFSLSSPSSLTSTPLWTAVHGEVYDLSPFIASHPGGSVIKLAAGRDSTALIESYHSKDSMKRVYGALHNKCHRVGTLLSSDPQPALPPTFFLTVQSRVDDYLKSRKWNYHTFESLALLESVLTCAAYLASCYYSCFHGSLVATLTLGMLTARMGFLMHTGNHCATSVSRVWNTIVGTFMNIIGSSNWIWQHEHQVAHHLDPNELNKDNDCAIGNPFIRMHPHLPWYWPQQLQHITVPFAISFGFIKWFISDFVNFAAGEVGSVKFAASFDQWLVLIVFKAVWFVVRIVCPFYFFSLPYALLLTLVPLAIGAHYLENIFIVNHIQHGLVPPSNAHWSVKQVIGTSNWGSHSHLWNFVSGGLNHQIEHHLFPSMNTYLYPYISQIVRQTCKEFGLPYHNYDSFSTAYLDMLRYLRAMGQQDFTPTSFVSIIQKQAHAQQQELAKGVRVGTKSETKKSS